MVFPLGDAFVFRVTSLRVVSCSGEHSILFCSIQMPLLQSKLKDVILFWVLLLAFVAATLLSEMWAELKDLGKLSWTLI